MECLTTLRRTPPTSTTTTARISSAVSSPTPFELSENRWLKGLGFGFAGSYGDERGTTISTYKTYGMSTWFTYNSGVTASGLRARLEPQAYYYGGAVWLDGRIRAGRAFAEPVHDGRHRTVQTADQPHRHLHRHWLHGSGFVHADRRRRVLRLGQAISSVRPAQRIRWGAWEVAARISNVAADTRQFQLGFASSERSGANRDRVCGWASTGI